MSQQRICDACGEPITDGQGGRFLEVSRQGRYSVLGDPANAFPADVDLHNDICALGYFAATCVTLGKPISSGMKDLMRHVLELPETPKQEMEESNGTHGTHVE